MALESLEFGFFGFLLATVQNSADARGTILVIFAALDTAHVLEGTLQGLF